MRLVLPIHVALTVRLECKKSGVGVKTDPFLKPEWFMPQGEKNASI
jgi:hypothetical protein